MTTVYFVEDDGFGEPCLWTGGQDLPTCVMRSSDVHERFWPDVVARMTGTTQTQLETATVQLKTISGIVDRLRADMRTWQRAAAERTQERDEANDQLEATTRALDAYRADRDELSELLAKANDGTTITNDDATVKRVAMALLICEAGPDATEFIWDDKYATRARAVLAALTGVPQ